jgi:hypothetical protein
MMRMSKCHIQADLRNHDLTTGRCERAKRCTEREGNRSVL